MFIIIVGNWVGGVLWKQWNYISSARKGDFRVSVRHLQGYRLKKLTKWSAIESFAVHGVPFLLRDLDLSKAGFNKTAGCGGPFRAGLYARLAHKDGCTLKIGIVKKPAQE
jgi:hypothetical protein